MRRLNTKLRLTVPMFLLALGCAPAAWAGIFLASPQSQADGSLLFSFKLDNAPIVANSIDFQLNFSPDYDLSPAFTAGASFGGGQVTLFGHHFAVSNFATDDPLPLQSASNDLLFSFTLVPKSKPAPSPDLHADVVLAAIDQDFNETDTPGVLNPGGAGIPAIPEPSIALLLMPALGLLAWAGRRSAG